MSARGILNTLISMHEQEPCCLLKYSKQLHATPTTAHWRPPHFNNRLCFVKPQAHKQSKHQNKAFKEKKRHFSEGNTLADRNTCRFLLIPIKNNLRYARHRQIICTFAADLVRKGLKKRQHGVVRLTEKPV